MSREVALYVGSTPTSSDQMPRYVTLCSSALTIQPSDERLTTPHQFPHLSVCEGHARVLHCTGSMKPGFHMSWLNKQHLLVSEAFIRAPPDISGYPESSSPPSTPIWRCCAEVPFHTANYIAHISVFRRGHQAFLGPPIWLYSGVARCCFQRVTHLNCCSRPLSMSM
jgi:hypothetical protein